MNIEVFTILRQPRRLEPDGQARVTCLNGTAWITIEGLPDDIILVRGEGCRVEPGQRALLAGVPECRVSIEQADTAVRQGAVL